MGGYFDMYCHIIPEVDDGSDLLEESLAILDMEVRAGVTDIILTPHFRREMFEADRDFVEAQYNLLQEAAAKEFPGLHLYLGCEYHSNHDMHEMLRTDPRYRMLGTNYVLLEFSQAHSGSYIREQTYSLISRGFCPIIAHCERYRPISTNIKLAEELVDMGAELQVNADSVIGRDGWGIKRFCRKLMKLGLLSYIGSDAHNMMDRRCHMGECIDYVEKKMGRDYADLIMRRNPQNIVDLSKKQ